MAATVSRGRVDLPAHSTGWPDFAAHEAVGIASGARPDGATTTVSDGPPAARDCSRSIPRAIASGEPPPTCVDFNPSGLGTLPMRITWAPPAFAAPVGARSFNACWVT